MKAHGQQVPQPTLIESLSTCINTTQEAVSTVAVGKYHLSS